MNGSAHTVVNIISMKALHKRPTFANIVARRTRRHPMRNDKQKQYDNWANRSEIKKLYHECYRLDVENQKQREKIEELETKIKELDIGLIARTLILQDNEQLKQDYKDLRVAAEKAVKWLDECEPQIIKHNHGVPYDHINIAKATLQQVLAKGK